MARSGDAHERYFVASSASSGVVSNSWRTLGCRGPKLPSPVLALHDHKAWASSPHCQNCRFGTSASIKQHVIGLPIDDYTMSSRKPHAFEEIAEPHPRSTLRRVCFGLMQSLLFTSAYRQMCALGFLNRIMQVSGLAAHWRAAVHPKIAFATITPKTSRIGMTVDVWPRPEMQR